MLFSSILVAYDGSEQSEQALQKAIQLVEQSPESKLHVIHVFELPQYPIGDAFISAPANIGAELYAQSERLTEQAKSKISHLNHTEVHLEQGNASKKILDYAAKMNCDIILIGSRGLGGFKELILGGVSNSVVQHAKVPVLVFK